MSAKSAFFIALAAAVLMLLPLLVERRRQKNPFAAKNPKLPYLRRPLMTPTETDVYAALLEALPDYMVFAQVQASRVLEVPKSRETYYWFNFVSRLSTILSSAAPTARRLRLLRWTIAATNAPSGRKPTTAKTRRPRRRAWPLSAGGWGKRRRSRKSPNSSAG